jgi:hypothetical protein
MDTEAAIREIEGAVEAQLRLSGEELVEPAESLMAAMQPALRQALSRLAEQAAAEVSAQLPDHTVDVVMAQGEPTLVVRQSAAPVTISTDDLEARLTVRLPAELKQHLEFAAGELGDSVNTYVVKALTTRARSGATSSKFRGTINT